MSSPRTAPLGRVTIRWAVWHGFAAAVVAVVLSAPPVKADLHAASVQAGLQVAQAEPASAQEVTAEIQESLATLGFDPGPADGVLGSQTRRAIAEAQRQLGWNADGQPSVELVRVLRRALAAREQAAAVPEASAAEESADDGESARQGPVAAGDQVSATAQTPGSEGPTADQAAAADAAAQPQAPAQSTYALTGSKWTMADSTGANFTLVLRPDGSVSGPVLYGEWSWRAEGNAVAIEYRSGVGHWVTRQGALDGGNAMRGTAESSLGNSWTWNATRMR